MKFPFFCLLKEFLRDHDQVFPVDRPAALLLALILLPFSYVLGTLAAAVIPAVPASADGNWGLSFQQEGKPPIANAGYENGNTPAILDALKKHQVPAAFFVVGNYLETSPDLVKRMVSEGHIVANHTYHHPDMSKISDPESFAKELTGLETLYTEITGETMKKYYRPPQGKYSKTNLQMAKDLGYQTFFWSLAYVDWYQDKQPTKEEAFKKLLGRIHPGAIVLLHSTSSTNAAILDELLTKWEEMGYRFGTLDELVRKTAAIQ